MKLGLFEITLGRKGEDEIDNWDSINVLAMDAQEAINRVNLKKDEFLVGVKLLGRES